MRNIPSAITVLEFYGTFIFTIPFNTLSTLDFGLSRRAPSGCVKQGGSGTIGYWKTVETSIFCQNDRKSNLPNISRVSLAFASFWACFNLFLLIKITVAKLLTCTLRMSFSNLLVSS